MPDGDDGEAGPILVFDSGIGGLSVLSAIRARMPQARFVYVADDAAFPYGDWEEAALIDHIAALMEPLIAAHRPAVVVVACNTASTLVLPRLRQVFAVPFVGTVPAIKPAAKQTESGIVAVLATPGTMTRDYTRDLIRSFAGDCHVRLVGAPGLAAQAEALMHGGGVDRALIADEIAPCFVEIDDRRTDIVVLACTHYPFLTEIFTELAPWPVTWLDPATAIARRVAAVTEKGVVAHGGPSIAIFTRHGASRVPEDLLAANGLVPLPDTDDLTGLRKAPK